MQSSRLALVALFFAFAVSGCMCAQLPNATFKCEPDHTCAQPGFECGNDNRCHPIGSINNDGGSTDAGVDAGTPDAGTPDAGDVDSGVDAGDTDAGVDAGDMDSGVDAGDVDAGDTDAGFDAGTDAGCTPTGAIDEPDMLGADVDCDGFDGDLLRAVFVDPVGGNDGNAGTRAMPKQTIAAALATGKTQLYLATGTYTAVDVSEAVAVFGGYTPSGAWPRTSTRSVVTGSFTAQPSDAGRVVFERLEVNGDDGMGAGQAAVALRLINTASTSVLSDLRIVAGTGALGSPGAAAAASPTGNPGSAGVAGDTGSNGGSGGNSANCGDAGLSPHGFDGGAGATTTPGTGNGGHGGAVAGFGGSPAVCDGGACVPGPGDPALDGTDGMMSAARPAEPAPTFLGSVIANQWTGAQLGTWAPASHGNPGGGGGGGAAVLDIAMAIAARGGGGGAGGSGGCGGRSGGAGGPGGASIGVLLIDSSPTFRNVTLVTTAGGRGGDGATGAMGGTGGAPGTAGAGETVPLGTGGSGGLGGRGGRGGAGRQGPGGWGGPLIGVFCSGTSAPTLDGTTTWPTMGMGGMGGNGDPNGRAGGTPVSGLSTGCP
ncbi:MAG: hypothetical protein QM817_33050 [Archangium sp.]